MNFPNFADLPQDGFGITPGIANAIRKKRCGESHKVASIIGGHFLKGI
jgi:hypothetical protein